MAGEFGINKNNIELWYLKGKYKMTWGHETTVEPLHDMRALGGWWVAGGSRQVSGKYPFFG